MGGRAPPGQNMRMPYAVSHWLGVARGSHVPVPSSYQPNWSERQPANHCQLPCRLIQLLNVCGTHPILAEIDVIAAQRDEYNHARSPTPYARLERVPQV